MKSAVKEFSGSIKIDPEVYKKLYDYCQKQGIKISFFASEAVSEKLQKAEKSKK
jgi:DNA-binding sugar fermentation-stimulating protein